MLCEVVEKDGNVTNISNGILSKNRVILKSHEEWGNI